MERLVFDEILQRLQAKVRALDYVMTIHADEEMDDDGLNVFDVEQAILNGRIVERQRDRHTREWKYLIEGQAQDSSTIIVVTKLSPTDKLVIITVYVE